MFLSLYRKYISTIKNIGYLTALQVLNVIFPLMTYPYLINTLGREQFGLVILAQSLASFLCVLVSYGYNLTGTRDISRLRHNLDDVSDAFSVVMNAKFYLFIFAIFIYTIVV